MCSLVVIGYLSFLLLNVSECVNYSENLSSPKTKRQNSIRCTLPEKPEFGDWEVLNARRSPGETIAENSVVRYTCNEGYKLSSSSPYKICDEHWNLRNIPTCKQQCPPFYSTSTTILTCRDEQGTKTDCSEVIDGGTLSYECIPFYEVPRRSPKQLFCHEGKWSSSKPLCEPVCGKKVVRKFVVPAVGGGKLLKTVEYPWITAIYQKDHDVYSNICGGNIITRRLILTAAHCITNDYGDPLSPTNYKVAAAKLYNRYQDSRDSDAQYLDVDSIIVHPQYKGESRRYVADIGIITTKQLFTLGPLIQPVCFKGVGDIYLHAAYDRGEVAGWGLTEDGLPSEELRFLDIPYKSQTRCEQELPPEFAEKFKFEDKICAGFHNQNISVCTGDSGSGLVFKNQADDDRYYLHGVVSITPSSGEIGKCNLQQNSLYTKVAYYYEWVEKYITRFQVEDCKLPPYPENGKYVVESDKSKKPQDMVFSNEWLKVTCNEGYLPTISKINCESANFNTLKCQAEKTCPVPRFPQRTVFACTNQLNNILDCSKAKSGIALQYMCPDGYVSSGSTLRFCNAGSWGTPPPQCIPIPTQTVPVTADVTVTTKKPPQSRPGTNYNYKVICTYGTWAAYKGIYPEALNPSLCTHINYAYAGLWEKGDMRVQDDALELDMDTGLYKRVTDLKRKNKNLKVLLSIGGSAAANNSLFSIIAGGGPSKINPFIGSTSYFIETYGFDGVNIEWLYPHTSDKENYIHFLRQVKSVYESKGWLLTVTVRADPEKTGYDPPKLDEIVDWVIINTFDFYGGWSTQTGIHTALYSSPRDYIWEQSHLNVHSAVELWSKAGLSKTKMVISVAFYGRSNQLKDKKQHVLRSPTVGDGVENGQVDYSDICSKYANWTDVWDEPQKSCYKYKDDQWFSYDSKDAIWTKGEYVKNKGLLGVNVWSFEKDDLTGKCGRKFNLLKHLHGGLGHEVNWNED